MAADKKRPGLDLLCIIIIIIYQRPRNRFCGDGMDRSSKMGGRNACCMLLIPQRMGKIDGVLSLCLLHKARVYKKKTSTNSLRLDGQTAHKCMISKSLARPDPAFRPSGPANISSTP